MFQRSLSRFEKELEKQEALKTQNREIYAKLNMERTMQADLQVQRAHHVLKENQLIVTDV